MSIIQCFERECQNDADHYCSCTSPETQFCKFHYADHCISNIGPHTLNSLFLKTIKETKNVILRLLEEEMPETLRMKAQILDSFNFTLKYYENHLKEILKEIDSQSEKVKIHYEKILKAKRVSKFENDEVLNLLLLQPNEAAQNVEAILTTNLNNTTKLVHKMNHKIFKIIENFNNEKLKNEARVDKSVDIDLNKKIGPSIYEANSSEEEIKYQTNVGQKDTSGDDICLNELSFFRSQSKIFSSVDLNTFQISSKIASSKMALSIQEDIWSTTSSCILPDKTYFYCCNPNSSSGYTFTIDKDRNVKQLQNSKVNYFANPIYYNNFIYLIGGHNKLAERYDFKRNIWESMAPITQDLNFNHSCNALYKDLILITGFHMQKILIYNIPQNNYQEVRNLVLNAKYFKLMFQGNNRIYVFEKSGRTFESAENNISSWTQIANNTITNDYNQSGVVLYKGCFYFVVYEYELWKFDLSSKQASKVTEF